MVNEQREAIETATDVVVSDTQEILTASIPSDKKTRAYVFTYNNPQAFAYDGIVCTYIIVGAETAPTTGTPHHQGYIYFKNAIAFSGAKKKLPPGCYIASAKGSPQQNRTYCSKVSIHYEGGDIPINGKRNDLSEVKDIIKSGGGMRDVIDAVPNYQAVKFAETILKYVEPKRDHYTYVKWIWGPSGTGKTHMALSEATDPWLSPKNLQWWEGYDAHKHVIVEDFRRSYCEFSELLRILDNTGYTVYNKGGSRQLLATHIWITCPMPPHEVYDTNEEVRQLTRRIDEVIHLTEVYVPPTDLPRRYGGQPNRPLYTNNV